MSGHTPEHPVVSLKSGHLFEKSVVEKAIEATGKCPVTSEPLSVDDLLPLKLPSGAVKPRPVASASIPGMLSLFQNEWDALMLEMHTLKTQLETVRQELGHALYQHDAACRVIARLMKERDDARSALAAAQPTPPPAAPIAKPGPEAPVPTSAASAPAETGQAAAGMTPEMVATFSATAKDLSKGRKKRQPPADQASEEALAAYCLAGSHSLHEAGRTCVDMHPQQMVVATGGASGSIVIFDAVAQTTSATLAGHTERVNRVRLHPSKPLLVSCSADGTARCWSMDGESLHTLSAHSAEVTDCSLHATGDFYVTASADKSWILVDIERGSSVLAVKDADAGYTCAGFHADGLLLGTGMSNVVHIWDVKSQKNVASFKGHEGVVSCLAFSENGYYFATGAEDSTVKLWDLRKLKNFHTIEEETGRVGALHFDYAGSYLAVGGAAASVYEAKAWASVNKFTGHKDAVSGVCFGRSASMLATTSADGMLQLYASQ